MTDLTQTAPGLTRRKPGLLASLVAWLWVAEAAYRQRVQLRRTSDEHLADMGLTRADVERAWRR